MWTEGRNTLWKYLKQLDYTQYPKILVKRERCIEGRSVLNQRNWTNVWSTDDDLFRYLFLKYLVGWCVLTVHIWKWMRMTLYLESTSRGSAKRHIIIINGNDHLLWDSCSKRVASWKALCSNHDDLMRSVRDRVEAWAGFWSPILMVRLLITEMEPWMWSNGFRRNSFRSSSSPGWDKDG